MWGLKKNPDLYGGSQGLNSYRKLKGEVIIGLQKAFHNKLHSNADNVVKKSNNRGGLITGCILLFKG